MTSSSRQMETASTTVTTPPPNGIAKPSKVPSDQQPPALISFTPPPEERNPNVKSSSHSLPKPSMIPTVSEDTKASSRTKAKSLHPVKSIPTRIPSPRDKIMQATDEMLVKKDVPSSEPQIVQEVEANPPRRGTVAKLERQLAELRMMAAGSGLPPAKASAESNIPKSNSMLKKTSIETMKTTPLVTAIPVHQSNLTGGVEKKTPSMNKQSQHKNSITRQASQVKTNERSPKHSSRVKNQTRNDERTGTKASHTAKKKPEEKKSSSVCIFCEEQNDSFNEDTLVSHYWNDCPVLTSCPLCQIILEISTLSDHIVTDCEEKHRIKRCPRCKEVVPIDKWLQHSLRQNCTVVSSSETRCPLCREVIMPPTESVWKRHLLKEGGCPHNPRRLTIMDR
ncbi:hypothetical protein BC943DRAFT_150457 [Umbelopsis sp. AD052]|nr:hypothetical protein BC943DRAFT_150457 [Umbelopsis sp. AD052]